MPAGIGYPVVTGQGFEQARPNPMSSQTPGAAMVSNAPVRDAARGLSGLASNYGQGPLTQATDRLRTLGRRDMASSLTPGAMTLQDALRGGLGGGGSFQEGMGRELAADSALQKGHLGALESLLNAGGAVASGDQANLNRALGIRDADWASQIKGQSSKEFADASQPSGGLLGFLFGG